jgi:Protein of unknown function (DUF3105)
MTRRPPILALVALALLLPVGPAALLLGAHDGATGAASGGSLASVARAAGCTVRDYEDDRVQVNPPVAGPFVERVRAADGSYVGRRPPSTLASLHALLHGRVLIQYRPDTDAREIRALDRLVRADPDRVLLFENRTGMRPRVAATAYLSAITCPRADPSALRALTAFRAQREAFAEGA